MGRIIYVTACLLLLSSVFAIYCPNVSQIYCGQSECQYYKWSNGTCVQPATCPTTTVWLNSTFNCAACSELDSINCASCSAYGYYYETTLSKCVQCVTLYGASCQKCSATACTSCLNSLTLAADKLSCVDSKCGISYCASCQNSTACKTCDNLHKLYNGICICSIANCKFCFKGVCSQCLAGYWLGSDLTCKPICIASCSSCADTTTCTTCLYGYKYVTSSSGNKCILDCSTISVANCISCVSQTVCTECSKDYSLNIYGSECTLTCSDSNCDVCSTAAICSRCSDGFYLVNGTCKLDICTISSCKICEGFSTCLTCNDNYELSTDKTVCSPVCYKTDTKCVQCSDGTTCKTCATGYKVVASKCAKLCSISDCDLCLSEIYCSSCAEGFKVDTSLSKCIYDCRIDGCTSCATTTTCKTCATGYTLTSGDCLLNCQIGGYLNITSSSCQNCPDNCLDCSLSEDNINVLCNECDDFYYLDSTFTCRPCSSIDANCFECLQDSATCTACNKGYVLSGAICTKEIVCTLGNCEVCNLIDQTKCQTCKPGYIISTNSTCQKQVCPAQQFLEGSVCTCGNAAYYQNKKCKPCKKNCISCTASGCTSCIAGYYPSGDNCKSCSDNCESCTSSSVCISCTDGYFLDNKACVEQQGDVPRTRINGKLVFCPAGCAACKGNSRNQVVCTKAFDGYVISSGNIYRCDPICLTCTNKLSTVTSTYSTCLSCYEGTAYFKGNCTSCTDINARSCSSRDASYSLSCVTRFTPVDGVCIACGDHCLKCNNNGKGSCDEGGCESGYLQMTGSTQCITCFSGCTTCDTVDPNICLACGDFKFIKDSKCYSCGSNCVTCDSATVCKKCSAGYIVKTNGACAIPPGPPCISYDAALTCTACTQGFDLAAGICSPSMNCNTTKTCTVCPYNYYLSEMQCFSCPYIANCNSCKSKTTCQVCNTGFYLANDLTCKSCKDNCYSCSSLNFCNIANPGYYLVINDNGANTGKSKPCNKKCAQCYGGPTFCKSCPENYTLSGSQCIYNKYYQTKMVGSLKSYTGDKGNKEQGQLFLSLTPLLKEMMKLFGFSNFEDFTTAFQLSSARSGSAIFEFGVSADAISSSPSDLIKQDSFTMMQNLETTTQVRNTLNTTPTSTSEVSLALVLGVAIPLGVLLIAIIVIIKVKYSSGTEGDDVFDPSEKEIEYNDQF